MHVRGRGGSGSWGGVGGYLEPFWPRWVVLDVLFNAVPISDKGTWLRGVAGHR